MTTTIQSDFRSAHHVANLIIVNPNLILSRATASSARLSFSPLLSSYSRISTPKSFLARACSSEPTEPVVKVPEKPPICTADELHYVSVSNSDWRPALWRYHPSPQAPPRNHPLLLLSGVGTNAIGYDLSPGASFARYMSGQGFETWILEVRGAGLSLQGSTPKDAQQTAHEVSEQMEAVAKSVTNGSLSTDQQPKRLSSTIEDFQKQLDLIVNYEWDFDNYLEEDVPAAVRWSI
ncbi:hypothetical protein OIU84_019136 [Salix udensis]|uniref:AB hydrolase-1 domain-containing protein n=1 Tax=Salix udensis TaxID=889485 RepID=A0AAD6KY59_9ROSI|nr:hypothetical protein OIU84_019136 [Salix udensis]